MTNYVDGFVVPVPKDSMDAYRKMAETAKIVWHDHGALDYVEAVADDVKVGDVTSFPRSVLMKPDETVVFSYIVYKSREHRDEVLKKVMSDPRLKDSMNPEHMPFDAKRMFMGGFKVIVQ